MTTQEIKREYKRTMVNCISERILKNCRDRNRGYVSAIDEYKAIRETLDSCNVGMMVKYDGQYITQITLFDRESGDDLVIADVVMERR